MLGLGFLPLYLMIGGLGEHEGVGYQTFLDISKRSKAKPLERKLSLPEKHTTACLVPEIFVCLLP